MSKADDKRREQSDRITESLKEQERRREEIKFQEEWNKRIDIAREGRVSYENADAVTAAANYKKILTLTARRHNVPLTGLHPKLFEEKIRISECLLISAISFDLAKIISRLDGEAALKDLRIYLKLFVTFSKGMPYEVVATATIRKFVLYTHGLKNKEAFEKAYKELRKGGCFIATAAFENHGSWHVKELRRWRDSVLWRSPAGRNFIAVYYAIGPHLARIIRFMPGARLVVRFILSKLVNYLRTERVI